MNKKLSLSIKLTGRRLPVLAIGFISPTEFIVLLWPVGVRLAWGY